MFQKHLTQSSLIAVLMTLPTFAADGAKISAIKFRGTESPNRIEVNADQPLQIQKTVNEQDKQIILEIPGATLEKGARRNIDTSSFDSKVSLISPYQAEGNVRIVIQLRENVTAELKVDGQTATLDVPSGAAVLASSPPENKAPEVTPVSDSTPPKESSTIVESKSESSEPPVAQRPSDSMDKLLDANQSKKFTGKPITLQIRDVDVKDVFNLIAETSGFNIIVSNEVSGHLSLSLVDVPWDQALDVVLATLHLGADRRGNVLRIMTLDGLTKEKQQEIEAKKVVEAITPKITRVFPISYASLGTLKTTLTDLTALEAPRKSANAAASAGAPGGAAGVVGAGGRSDLESAPLTVVTDERTNSLIVRGTPEYVDRARKIIEILDTQTPQVSIEGKVVEASETFSRSISGGFGGVGMSNTPSFGAAFNGANPYGQLFGAGGTVGTFDVSGANSAMGAAAGYSFLTGSSRINLTLQLAENEGKVKVVSSPKAVVLNKQSTSITQSFPAVVQTQTVGAAGTTTTFTQVSGNLSLTATPTVTSDGSVLLQLSLSRDVVSQVTPQSATVAARNINTQVLVDNGSTLVLGGFYNNQSTDSETGIPFFRKIPIIGWLFGSQSHGEQRSELLFFITPQIINAKKAGFATSTGSAIPASSNAGQGGPT